MKYKAVLCLLCALMFISQLSLAGGCTSHSSTASYNWYGAWEIYELESYRGGLLTQAHAEIFIGKQIVISQKQYQDNQLTVANPTYQIEYFPVPEEGDIGDERWSYFYGRALDRSEIKTLAVYKNSQALTHLEIHGCDLWLLYQGFIFKLKRVN